MYFWTHCWILFVPQCNYSFIVHFISAIWVLNSVVYSASSDNIQRFPTLWCTPLVVISRDVFKWIFPFFPNSKRTENTCFHFVKAINIFHRFVNTSSVKSRSSFWAVAEIAALHLLSDRGRRIWGGAQHDLWFGYKDVQFCIFLSFFPPPSAILCCNYKGIFSKCHAAWMGRETEGKYMTWRCLHMHDHRSPPPLSCQIESKNPYQCWWYLKYSAPFPLPLMCELP